MVLHVAIDPDYYFIWTLVCLENSLIEKKTFMDFYSYLSK